MVRNKYLILNYIFVISIVVLILNDHFFKYQYSNWLTGKLSDFVGLIILPLLLTYLIPQLKTKSIWISALFFIFWKSPFSQSLIDFYNQFSLIKITRVVDHSDLIAFIVLPIPYYLIKNIEDLKQLRIKTIHPSVVVFPCLLALMSTSPPIGYYYKMSTNGNLKCFKCSLKVNLSTEELVNRLEQNNIKFDTFYILKDYKAPDVEFGRKYRIKQFIIEGDTIRNIEISIKSLRKDKSEIYFNGAQLDKFSYPNIVDKDARKRYEKILFNEFKKSF